MLTATVFTYFHQCRRKMWLHAHEIRMEHTSELVALGRVMHETSYSRRSDRYRELQLPGMKLDQYEPEAGVVHEVKKSPKRREAHLAQLKYYLWRLEQHGLKASHGVLEYPQQRQREEVRLKAEDRAAIPAWLTEIERLLAGSCPERLAKRMCSHCSYHDFCWSEEMGQDLQDVQD